MKKSKLIRVLQTFSGTELKELSKFVQSPFFNQRIDLQSLLDLLIKQFKQNKREFIKKEIWSSLYPTAPFDSSKMDLLMSYLYKLVQQYLAWVHYNKQPFNEPISLLQSFRERGLSKDFEQTYQQTIQTLNEKPLRNAAYHNHLFQLQWELFEIKDMSDSRAKAWQFIETFDISYLATKLKYLCLLRAHQMVYPLDYKPNLLTAFLSEIEHSDYLKIPVINLYYHCYLMINEPNNEKQFYKYKQLLFELDAYFSNSEKRDLMLLGINHCVRQVNEGKEDYLVQLLTLYEGGLKNNYLIEKGILSRFTFHNIVGTGLASNKIEWVANFIKQYHPYLEKRHRDSTYSFNLARLEYHRQNYDEVLQLLQKSNYRDLLLNLAAKTLLLKVYVEQDQDGLLISHLEAMQRYIRRKHIIGYHKKNYLNLIKYTKKMRSLNFFDKEDIELFRAKVQAEEILTEKAWFLAQIALL